MISFCISVLLLLLPMNELKKKRYKADGKKIKKVQPNLKTNIP